VGNQFQQHHGADRANFPLEGIALHLPSDSTKEPEEHPMIVSGAHIQK